MKHRTTILLDDETRAAARELARKLGCSTSEAIRRSILRLRDLTAGVPEPVRRKRVEAFERLFELFEGSEPEEEVHRLKSEDDGF